MSCDYNWRNSAEARWYHDSNQLRFLLEFSYFKNYAELLHIPRFAGPILEIRKLSFFHRNCMRPEMGKCTWQGIWTGARCGNTSPRSRSLKVIRNFCPKGARSLSTTKETDAGSQFRFHSGVSVGLHVTEWKEQKNGARFVACQHPKMLKPREKNERKLIF